MANDILRAALALLVPFLLTGCGVEGLINLHLGRNYTQPVSVVRGTLALPPETIRFRAVDVNGQEVKPFAHAVAEGRYEVQFLSGEYTNLRLQGIAGQALVEAWVPALKREGVLDGVNLDAESTAAVKLIEGRLQETRRPLPSVTSDVVCIAEKKIKRQLSLGAADRLVDMIDRILNRANKTAATTTYTFQEPLVRPGKIVETSPLNPDWVARANFDYDHDGILNQDTAAFDAVYTQALDQVDVEAPEDPDLIRVLFTVDFNEGKRAGDCGPINRFRWVRNEPGKQMFFVGGIHQSSPVQDPRIDAMLGNRGGWTPNVIKMYDDGTNGDRTANDGIWSIYFDLPRGLRMGYKYTWGRQGDLWTGSEEWPGNQRILEVADRNGDGYVFRVDNFGDEATNKDLANANPAAGGSVGFGQVLRGETHPQAGEIPVDAEGNNCGPERNFVTPRWVPKVTISCARFAAE